MTKIISESLKVAEHYTSNKRLTPPVQYYTGKKFGKRFDKPKLVDIISCDSEQEKDQSYNLNDIATEQVPSDRLNNTNGLSAANSTSNNIVLLPWIPRSVKYTRQRNDLF